MTQYNPYDTPTPFTSVDPATPTTPPTPTPTPTTPPPTPTPPPPKYPNYTGPGNATITIVDPSEIDEKDPKKRTKDKTISTTGITIPWRISPDLVITQLNPTILVKTGLTDEDKATHNFGDLNPTLQRPKNNVGEPLPPQEEIDAWFKEEELRRMQKIMREYMIKTLDPSIQDPDDRHYRVGTVATPPEPNAPITPVTPIPIKNKNTTTREDLIKDQKAKQKEELGRRIASLKVTIDMRNAQKVVLQKELKKKDAELKECQKAWLSLFPDYCRQLVADWNKLTREINSIIKNNAADSKQMKDFQNKLDAIK